VRQKAKEITALLADEDRLREERRKLSAGGGFGNQFANPYANPYANQMQNDQYPPQSPQTYQPPPPANDVDADLQRALEESRRTHAEEARKRNGVREEVQDEYVIPKVPS